MHEWKESVEEAQVGVPFSALNALMNLSFDAVLNKWLDPICRTTLHSINIS